MKPIAEIKDVKARFVAFVIERENCRHAKELGVVPHTDDPILLENRFCNVNREHDAVTVWVKKNVRDRADLDHRLMVMHLLVARIFNNPAALGHVIPFTDTDRVAIRLNALRNSGQSVFRGAYMMVVHGDAGRGKNAINFYCNLVSTVDMMGIGEPTGRLVDVANLINGVTGLGRFMANQIVTDLRYTRFYPQDSTEDWGTFIWGGPGTIRGLRRYFSLDIATGRPVQPTHKQAVRPLSHGTVPELIMAIREEIAPALPVAINKHFEDPNNLSNCFCEFDKYERVLGIVPAPNERKPTLRKYKP